MEDAENQLERQSFKYRCFEKNQRKRTTILRGNSMTETRLVLRGSGGRNALVILEGKIKDKKAKGSPKRMCLMTSGNGQC